MSQGYLSHLPFNIIKAQIHGMHPAGKFYLNPGALLAAVYFDYAAFYALERAFNNNNAFVFVKAYQRRANARSQPQKMLDNCKIIPRQCSYFRIAFLKMVKIGQRLQSLQSFSLYSPRCLHNYIRRKHRLHFPQSFPLIVVHFFFL